MLKMGAVDGPWKPFARRFLQNRAFSTLKSMIMQLLLTSKKHSKVPTVTKELKDEEPIVHE